MGILKKNKKIFSKLENKGQSCMFVGYSNEHAPDTYRIFVLGTRRIVVARDVLWLNAMYNEIKERSIQEPDINIDLWEEKNTSIDCKKVNFASDTIDDRNTITKRKQRAAIEETKNSRKISEK